MDTVPTQKQLYQVLGFMGIALGAVTQVQLQEMIPHEPSSKLS